MTNMDASSAVTAAWHAQSADEVATLLGASPSEGLAPDEAVARLARHGFNELQQTEGASWLAILAGQFASLVVWVLIGAAAVSIALGEVVDGVAIIAIVGLNAVIGFFQEHRGSFMTASELRATLESAAQPMVARAG